MSDRFKEQIVVSVEIKTILRDLYNQIEFELRDDYNDALEKALNKIDKAIDYIKENTDNTNFIEVPSIELLEILGDKENE